MDALPDPAPAPADSESPALPEPEAPGSSTAEEASLAAPTAGADDLVDSMAVLDGVATKTPRLARAALGRPFRYAVSDDDLDAYTESQLELVLLIGLGGVLLGLAWSCLLFLLIGDPPTRAAPIFRAIALSSAVLLLVLVGFAVIPFRQQRILRRRWRRSVRRRRSHETD